MENSGLSPDAVVSGDGEGQKPNDGDEGPLPRKPGSKAEGRKRTKTGCLTCRRRRIKCGEERPNCQNCRKSKRHCEGYNQRVVFKDPLNAYRGPQLSASSQVAPSESLCIPPVSHQGETHRQSSTGQTPLPIIAPKPAQPLGYSMKGAVVARISALPMTAPVAEARMDSIPNGVTTDYPTTQKGLQTKSGTTVDRDLDPLNCSHIAEPSPFQQMQASKLHFNPVTEHEAGKVVPKLLASSTMLDWSAGPSTASTSSSQELFYDSNSLLPVSGPFYQSYQRTSNFTQALTSSTPITATFPAQGSESAILHKQLEDLPGASETAKHRHIGCTQPQQRGPQWDPPPTTTGPVDPDPARQYRPVEHFSQFDMSDDDSNMEEQDGSDSNVEDDHLENNDLGIVVALQARQDTQDLRLRSFTSFINRPDMLVMYVPSPGSSPLRDSMTARIFCHFINVTGPSISLSERHPANPSLIFQGQPVPKSQQHIWTYTFPTLALQNPALLHAMLAIASLQIANLQNGSVTASLKHYAISLRKVAKSVSLPTRRGQPATLAAALLLAAYECWCADHQKWSNHLLGAKQLVREINFAEMTRYVKSVKLQQRREERMSSHHVQHEYGHEFYDEKTRHRTYVDDVDENIVSILMGNKLRYDQYGHILDDKLPDSRGSKLYTQRDLDIYETQRDLFWWYCKQDVLQSILGGGRLFMEYTLWSHCPPRAPLGRLNATYGTYDHLVLLMGRLADFSFRDLRRKKLCMKANGGHWRPPRSMRIQTQLCHIQNQQGRPQQVPSTSQQPPQIPGFSGMMPSVGEATLPMGFTASKDDYSPGSHRDDIDLGAMTLEAEEEWQEIRNTFSILEDHFGEDFQALDPEFSTPIQTPFGTALQYRTYGIACIWMNYYMALIACYRAHPSMPPAAMAAAGIASRQTASFANELGRIAAGLTPDSNLMQVSPGVGGALMESSTCLFVASVQYQNAAQRNWTVSRLQDITRLTGWQTAMAILNGCETAWVRASEMGNGPPYTRTSEPGVVPKTWSSSRRLGNALADLSKDERLTIKGSDRVHYALGILGVQEDLQKLDLDPDEVSIQGS